MEPQSPGAIELTLSGSGNIYVRNSYHEVGIGLGINMPDLSRKPLGHLVLDHSGDIHAYGTRDIDEAAYGVLAYASGRESRVALSGSILAEGRYPTGVALHLG